MKFREGPSTRRLTVLAQDPVILDGDNVPLFTKVEVPAERLMPGPKSSRFHIIDYDSATGKMLRPAKLPEDQDPFADKLAKASTPAARRKAAKEIIADPVFHAQNCYALAAATLLEFERALGRRINWGFAAETHQLKIVPHAFSDMNAFYSREDEMLAFGYFPKVRGAKAHVFTCLSHDIVVHETTHAILDGLRTEYTRPSSIDQGALHEAFADIVALLSAFKSKELIRFALRREDEGDENKTILKNRLQPDKLRQTVLAGVAEEFGQSPEARRLLGLRGDALRQSAKMKPGADYYKDPDWRRGVHTFGEVLVAPVMNTFLDIWSARTEPLAPVYGSGARSARIDLERAVEEGAKAAEHLLGMCIRALDYLPPVNVTFTDYLAAVLTADIETAPDDSKYQYRDKLRQAFSDYGIPVLPTHKGNALEGSWNRPDRGGEIVYGFAGHAEMLWDREAIYRFIWENANALKVRDEAYCKVVSVRPVVRRGPDGAIIRETVAEYLQIFHGFREDVEALKPSGGGRSDHIEVPEDYPHRELIRLYGGGTLVFDDYGHLKYHIGSGVFSKKQTDRLQSLVDLGYFEAGREEEGHFVRLHRERAMGGRPVSVKEQWS